MVQRLGFRGSERDPASPDPYSQEAPDDQKPSDVHRFRLSLQVSGLPVYLKLTTPRSRPEPKTLNPKPPNPTAPLLQTEPGGSPAAAWSSTGSLFFVMVFIVRCC